MILRIIATIILVTFITFGHYITITTLLKDSNDLTYVVGIVNYQHEIEHRGKGAYKAIVLGVNGSNLHFAVQDNKERAFNYLLTHNIVGHPIKLMYDANGFNDDHNLTFHLFRVIVDSNEIMTMEEAKQVYKYGLIFILIGDVLLAILFINRKKFKSKRGVSVQV